MQVSVPLALTGYVEVARLLQQQVQVGEVLGYEEPGIAHEVEDVSEHASVSVDKVVLLQGVQHDGDAPVEELRQPRLRVPEKKDRIDQINPALPYPATFSHALQYPIPAYTALSCTVALYPTISFPTLA